MQVITRARAKALGLKRYFTGKPCKHGHRSERHVVDWTCVECRRIWDREHRDLKDEWARRNPTKARQTHLNANQKRRREKLEEVRKYDREWRRKRRRDKGEQVRAEGRARQRRDRQDNPEKIRLRDRLTKHQRHAQRMASASTFTAADWQTLIARSLRCHWCKRPFNGQRHATHDHVIPLAKGGENTLENSCCACAECNSRKRDRLINPATGQGILL